MAHKPIQAVPTTEPPRMDNCSTNTYNRFPPDILCCAVWHYYRFNLGHRDIEDLLVERGITVSFETIRLWYIKFVAKYSKGLQRMHGGYDDTPLALGRQLAGSYPGDDS